MSFKERLCNVLQRDTFFAEEVKIFKGVQMWITKNPELDSATVLDFVRLPIIPYDELFKTVKKSGLLTSDKLLQVLEDKTNFYYTPRIRNIQVWTEASEDFDMPPLVPIEAEINFDSDDSYDNY